MIERIELTHFTNKIALDMALKIIKLAEVKNQRVAIEIRRLNHVIFSYIDDSLPADKHNWLKRKANLSMLFEQSSLSIKNDLKNGKMSLKETFALENHDYVAKGGAIPIFVKNSGMVGIITVSGLKDVEDHQIIVEALRDEYIYF